MREKKIGSLITFLGVVLALFAALFSIMTAQGDRFLFADIGLQVVFGMVFSLLLGMFMILYLQLMKPRLRVFVSFTAKDEFVVELLEALRRRFAMNISTADDIYIGDNIKEKLNSLIDSSSIVIPIIPQNYYDIDEQQELLKLIFEKHKVVMPIVSKDIEIDKLPIQIRSVKYITYNENGENDIRSIINSLEASIRSVRKKGRYGVQ